jgi:hypothetical protein
MFIRKHSPFDGYLSYLYSPEQPVIFYLGIKTWVISEEVDKFLFCCFVELSTDFVLLSYLEIAELGNKLIKLYDIMNIRPCIVIEGQTSFHIGMMPSVLE